MPSQKYNVRREEEKWVKYIKDKQEKAILKEKFVSSRKRKYEKKYGKKKPEGKIAKIRRVDW